MVLLSCLECKSNVVSDCGRPHLARGPARRFYTFDKANGNAPSTHRTQYFEMMGVQRLYNDGWMLSAIAIRLPWQLLGTAIPNPASAYKFELFDVKKSWSQANNVAAAIADKVREMTALMFAEFAKYQVLPLDASVATRW
jgi:arylsulfatase A-like enzyme